MIVRVIIRGASFFLGFLKTIFGVLQFPHSTFQRISSKGNILHLFFIWLLVFFSLLWCQAVKQGVFRHPLFFAISFGALFLAAVISFLFVVLLLFFLGKFFGEKGKFLTISLLWGFSYLPTIFWFLFVSFLFFLFPPPRGYTLGGYLLSGILIAVSIALFYWKLLLYYLTLRIGFKLTWGPIISISIIFFPAVGLYGYLLFRLGIFKVPFL